MHLLEHGKMVRARRWFSNEDYDKYHCISELAGLFYVWPCPGLCWSGLWALAPKISEMDVFSEMWKECRITYERNVNMLIKWQILWIIWRFRQRCDFIRLFLNSCRICFSCFPCVCRISGLEPPGTSAIWKPTPQALAWDPSFGLQPQIRRSARNM